MLMVKLRAIRMCSEEEYDDYLQKYSLKCGNHCDEYKLLHYNDFVANCRDMMSLESFSPYSMEFTILTDFNKRDLQGLHDVQQKHSGRGSYYEEIVPDVDHIEPVYSTMEREYCSNHPSLSQYAVSSNCSLSWVTMIVNAGERVLSQMGINERLSVDFVLQCYNRSDICEGMTMNEIATRLRQIGLVREEDAKHAMDEGESVCSIPLSQHYRFDVQKPEGYNRGGLMNLVSAGNPVLVAISMDLLQLRFVKDMREEEEVLRRSVYEPSIYGLVTGYVKTTDEVNGYWVFEGTPSPCESVNVKLPMRANETNTDFAGIAGYAFAIALKGGIPTTVAPTTVAPTTVAPSVAPTTVTPTTVAPTTVAPTTVAPTTVAPTTVAPTTVAPTTVAPTTVAPTTMAPTTVAPTTMAPTTVAPTTVAPTTVAPTTVAPTTVAPTTVAPTTVAPTTVAPTTVAPTPTLYPITANECWSVTPVPLNVEVITIGDNKCNEENERIDLSKYVNLKNVSIGNDCFFYQDVLNLTGLHSLERVMIGEKSFTKEKDFYGNDANRKLYVKNCDALKELKIGRYSFSDYSVIEIENVNSLELIEMGDMDSLSCSFYSASLELKNLPKLKSLLFGKRAFRDSSRLVLENLPELTSIQLGWNAFHFNDVESSTLVMRNLPKLTSLTTTTLINSYSFYYPHHITLYDIPVLTTVTLPKAFYYKDDVSTNCNIGELKTFFTKQCPA